MRARLCAMRGHEEVDRGNMRQRCYEYSTQETMVLLI